MLRKKIPNYLIKMVFEYLSNREGYVQIGTARSCVREIRVGCAQGSTLGPFLFNLYTSELDKVVSPWNLVAYADDAYVTIVGENSEELVTEFERVMTRHEAWLKGIGMICNKSKTEVVVFGEEDVKEIRLGDEKITTGKSMKMLGIWVDWNLKWKTQVEKTSIKCRAMGFALRYLNKYLTRPEMRKIFISHFMSKLCYGAPVWANSISYNQRSQLRSVYYKQIRLILRDFRFNLRRKDLATKLGVLSFDHILFRRMSVFVFGILQSLFPSELAGTLLSGAYHNPRQEERLVFFRDSKSLASRSHIISMAHAVVPKWKFDYLNLSKISFKAKLDELTA